jgi:deazaflavin-dependent oxidoreductase (nitroreductase family)
VVSTARRRRRIPPELVGRLMAPMSRNRAAVRVLARVLPATDRLVNRLTAGRATLFSPMLPMLMLVTTGRESGLPRRVPLLYAEIDGGLAVMASNFGFTHHPVWSANLLADPAATVIIRGAETPVRAQLLTGPDREAAWKSLLRLWPVYRDYARHAGRELRVFKLTEVRGDPAMARIRFQQEYDLSARALWSHIQDFYRIADWHPAVADSGEVEAGTRQCFAEGSGDRFVEVLDEAGTGDDRFHRYHMIENPGYVRSFEGTLRVQELFGDRCSITWEATLTAGSVPLGVGEQIFSGFIRAGLDALLLWTKENAG